MKLKDLERWLEDNPPKDMPFWPAARYTGRVGLRTSREVLDAGASPIHLGVDRAGGGSRFLCPFDAWVEWKHVDGAAGSLLTITSSHIDLELQVFHTRVTPDPKRVRLFLRKGQQLPAMPSDLGLSVGVHTHTEVVVPFKSKNLYEYVRGETPRFLAYEIVDEAYVKEHCETFDLHYPTVLEAMRHQVQTWNISEGTARYVIRQALPHYRIPKWSSGNKPTMHIDSKWLLQI